MDSMNGTEISPLKTILICGMLTIGVNGLSLIVLQGNAKDTSALRLEVAALRTNTQDKAADNYRASDALRDFKLRDYRMERNERDIEQCKVFIKNHNHK